MTRAELLDRYDGTIRWILEHHPLNSELRYRLNRLRSAYDALPEEKGEGHCLRCAGYGWFGGHVRCDECNGSGLTHAERHKRIMAEFVAHHETGFSSLCPMCQATIEAQEDVQETLTLSHHNMLLVAALGSEVCATCGLGSIAAAQHPCMPARSGKSKESQVGSPGCFPAMPRHRDHGCVVRDDPYLDAMVEDRLAASRTPPSGSAEGRESAEWTDEQCCAFLKFALRNVDLNGEVGPSYADVRLGVRAAIFGTTKPDDTTVRVPLEVERDAARYRGLRKSVSNPVYCATSGQFGVSMVHSEALDAAVDALLAAAEGKGE